MIQQHRYLPTFMLPLVRAPPLCLLIIPGTLVFLATGYLFVMSGYYYVSKPPQVKVGVKGRNLLGLSPNQVSVTANNPKSPVKAYLNKLHSPQPTVATTKLSPTQQAVQFEKPLTLPMFQNKPKQSTAQHSAFSKKKKNVDGTKSRTWTYLHFCNTQPTFPSTKPNSPCKNNTHPGNRYTALTQTLLTMVPPPMFMTVCSRMMALFQLTKSCMFHCSCNSDIQYGTITQGREGTIRFESGKGALQEAKGDAIRRWVDQEYALLAFRHAQRVGEVDKCSQIALWTQLSLRLQKSTQPNPKRTFKQIYCNSQCRETRWPSEW